MTVQFSDFYNNLDADSAKRANTQGALQGLHFLQEQLHIYRCKIGWHDSLFNSC